MHTTRNARMRQAATKMLLCVMFCVASLCVSAQLVHAEEVNLAFNKHAEASSREAANLGPANAFDGNKTAKSSRWASVADATSSQDGGPHWLYVDLGREETVTKVRLTWEMRKAKGYKIQVATGDAAPAADSNNWTTVYETNDHPANKNDEIALTTPSRARFVRLYIEHNTRADPDGGVAWGNVSLYEMEVLGEVTEAQDPTQNIARGAIAAADSSEASSLPASNAIDGSDTTRWASRVDATSSRDGGPHYLYVDFGSTKQVKSLRVLWEMRKAKGYKIQVATGETAPGPTSDAWQTVYSNADRPASINDTIELSEVHRARFVRVLIEHNTYADPDGGTAWGNISLRELEIYGGKPPQSVQSLADEISVTQPAKGDTQLTAHMPQSEAFDVRYNGTDYEQVIGADLSIYQPLVDTTVKVSFKVTEKANPSNYAFREFTVTVPGKYTTAPEDNAAPTIVPELREWKGGSGSFTPTASTRVLYADAAFKMAAEEFAADYAEMFGSKLVVAEGDTPQAGDIVFVRAGADMPGLGNEGYYLAIGESVTVKAAEPTGAYWSTRTLLQALKTSDNQSIPQGFARDYPLYKVRGFMLDVGRKSFSLDFLKQMVKELAWYKLNDFHIHLNDNYIQVEEYTNDTVDEAYSGFRMESDIKAGGNGGLNKADLTSKDMWYSKEDFRNFIKESRAFGVNIIPEFDMPAHSLAFTKVRPDLRTPTNLTRRGNDHLNLATKYNESLAFALSVWNEYMTGDNPVFDTDTTLHIGADEFEADGDAYRRFVNDLFTRIEATGHTARVWGSLSHIRGRQNVQVSGFDARGKRREMNLWNNGWANMKEMYNLGFGLINTNDGRYYVVPNAGYYYDYLNNNTVYNEAINSLGGVTIPAGDEQMLGGTFAVWNDMTGKKENGMSEYDIWDRIHRSAGHFGAAVWGKGAKSVNNITTAVAALGEAPGTNFGYRTPANEAGMIAQFNMDSLNDATGKTSALEPSGDAAIKEVDGKQALDLTQAGSSVNTGLTTVGLGNSLRVKVKRMSDSTVEQVLFESPYGAIMAVQKETGCVGISREGRDYSFNYTLPVGEWVELEFKNQKETTTLYVNGQEVSTIGKAGRGQLKATNMFPLARIGSAEHGFVGYVDDVRVATNADYATTTPLDKTIVKAASIAKLTKDAELKTVLDDARALMHTTNPSAEDMNAMVERLNERVAKLSFKKADYSEVDALLAAIPADLSVFSEESVAALTAARAGVSRDLPQNMQDFVNQYATNVKDAMRELKKRSVMGPEVQGMTVTASSEETSSETAPARYAVDGNESTFWHSKYSAPADHAPFWLTLALPSAQPVHGFTYVPRQGSSNGRMQQYTLEVSTDGGSSFKKVAEGTVADPSQTTTMTFEKVPGVTHVRLNILKAQPSSSFATAAELKVHAVDESINKTELNALITQVGTLSADNYKDASWEKLQTALTAAREASANDAITFEALTGATDALRESLLYLVAERPEIPQPVMHRVVFKVDGVAYGDPVEVEDGGTVSAPATNPTKENHVFKYWAVEQAPEANAVRAVLAFFRSAAADPEPYDFNTPVTGPLTLFAVFKPVENTNSGSGSGDNNNTGSNPGDNNNTGSENNSNTGENASGNTSNPGANTDNGSHQGGEPNTDNPAIGTNPAGHEPQPNPQGNKPEANGGADKTPEKPNKKKHKSHKKGLPTTGDVVGLATLIGAVGTGAVLIGGGAKRRWH
ncbi:discoidin domain-containing protein [Collinsella sp. zg1085]|uniref:discoidin domain-containing protein n=1 Tax=Collinsella sp. zg1085 TaxID=2844380 RepID=UPI001C0D1203|nr:discoidin domain-containing protein [Collinsella sp. zg1085]QWT17580.1 discoidin domain-containing protein [Collinsella sp. zg1085]